MSEGLEKDQVDRGNSVEVKGSGLPYPCEVCPPGTTAALGVLRRDLHSLEEDYDELKRRYDTLINGVNDVRVELSRLCWKVE